MPALINLSPAVTPPVSLAELKEYLRVDAGDTSQDGTISDLLTAAWAWGEVFTKKIFVRQTWRVLLDYFPGYYAMVTGQPGSTPVLSGPALMAGIRYAIVLPFPPVSSIVNFQYEAATGSPLVMNPATDYLQDLQSNPARLTPPFGQMWPVARVVLNAVQVDFQCGYAMPVTLTAPVGSPSNPKLVDAGSSYTFLPPDVGRPLSIPGAGPSGGTLNTAVASVFSPPTSQALVRDAISTPVSGQVALLANNPNGAPRHWSMIRTGIKFRVKADYDSLPLYLERAKDMLTPVRDLRL